MIEFRIPMAVDRAVTVTAPSPLSETEWRRLLRGLRHVFKPGLVIPEPTEREKEML